MSNTCCGSFDVSINSGTLACMRNAISYWLILVSISGSATVLFRNLLIELTASMTARCPFVSTPLGLLMYNTGSPVEWKCTPWNRLGKKPLCHCREAIG